MRHQVRGRKLGRTSSHKLATMRALSSALIKSQRIVTTVAKAKELRKYIEPIITRARKEDTSHNRRQIFSFLNDKEAIKTLYDVVVPEITDRPGGYTRIIKLGNRSGDGAPVAMIEFVDFNDVKPEGKDTKKKRTRRAGRKKTTTDTVAEEASKETAVTAESDTVVDEAEVKTEAEQPAEDTTSTDADSTSDNAETEEKK
jgi:large subunit ribosomal protein L17